MHQKTLATGQFGQIFPWFSSASEKNYELIPKSHVAEHVFRATPPKQLLKNFPPKCSPRNIIKVSS